jgi:ankyrin repeat protein
MYCCDCKDDPLKKQKIERLLKSECASPKAISFEYNGKSALSYLVQSNDVELIKWFISKIGSIKPSILFDMFNPSNDAANIINDYNMNEYEERMLELQADYDPFPPLSFKNKDTVSFMLSLFTDTYQKDLIRTIKNDFGDTLLCVACSEGDKEKIKLVVKHGGDPSTVPEINFNSHLLLEEVKEEIRKEEKIKWFLILQNVDQIQTNQDLLESDDPSVQLVCQLSGMHNDTLLRMIMPFM